MGGLITLIIPPCLKSGWIYPPHSPLNRHPCKLEGGLLSLKASMLAHIRPNRANGPRHCLMMFMSGNNVKFLKGPFTRQWPQTKINKGFSQHFDSYIHRAQQTCYITYFLFKKVYSLSDHQNIKYQDLTRNLISKTRHLKFHLVELLTHICPYNLKNRPWLKFQMTFTCFCKLFSSLKSKMKIIENIWLKNRKYQISKDICYFTGLNHRPRHAMPYQNCYPKDTFS